MHTKQLCFCGNNLAFEECCQPFINLKKAPDTAEQLMRSRYSAFVTENETYLLNTWHHEYRPQRIDFEPKTKWLGLKVKKTKEGSRSDIKGWVEFVARYKIAGKAERIEELSYFVKEDNYWLYAYAEARSWDEIE